MAKQMEARVALVTGGASGMGRATALAFAREGAKVVVADMSVGDGEETVRMVKAAGGEAIFFGADVSKAADVEALVCQAVGTYGCLDYAFNNAGISGELANTVDCTEENWDRTIAINLKGVWLCMKYEIPHMIKQGQGAIVNTSSRVGLVGSPTLPAYSASKGGVLQLTRTAAMEFGQYGIRVNAICPGTIRTPMFDRTSASRIEKNVPFPKPPPMGRQGEPEEIAEAVIWLCSDKASFVTGHPLVVDGGRYAG